MDKGLVTEGGEGSGGGQFVPAPSRLIPCSVSLLGKNLAFSTLSLGREKISLLLHFEIEKPHLIILIIFFKSNKSEF